MPEKFERKGETGMARLREQSQRDLRVSDLSAFMRACDGFTQTFLACLVMT